MVISLSPREAAALQLDDMSPLLAMAQLMIRLFFTVAAAASLSALGGGDNGGGVSGTRGGDAAAMQVVQELSHGHGISVTANDPSNNRDGLSMRLSLSVGGLGGEDCKSDSESGTSVVRIDLPGGYDAGKSTSVVCTRQAGAKLPVVSLKQDDDDADDVSFVLPCVEKHRWQALAESPPTGYNKKGTCPGCSGQAVTCSDCENIVPFGRMSISKPTTASVASMLAFQKHLPAGSRAGLSPMYSPEGAGTGANLPSARPDTGADFDGMISAHGVTGPAGADILQEPRCGNFSGPWWAGQVADVKTRWLAFLRAFKAGGGRLDEVILDTERSLSLEFVRLQPKSAGALDCARLRLAAIQRDRRFPALKSLLVTGGFMFGDEANDREFLWRAVGPSAAEAYTNKTQQRNGDVWNQIMGAQAARDFNESIAAPAQAVFGKNVSISDYGYFLCRAHQGFPDMYGNRGCGMPGTVSSVIGGGVQGVLVGNTQAPVCYQDFALYSAVYFLGGPRPGLAHGLNETFGVEQYPRTTFNVFRVDTFVARRAAAVAGTPFHPWVGYSRMGAGPHWPNGYGLTNGSGYYAETWFHHALAGSASTFLFYNTLSYQLDGADNQLLSDVLKELDTMLGCASRRWVRDWPVDRRQPWVDGYVLTGMELGGAPGDQQGGARVWRFTPELEEFPKVGDVRQFVVPGAAELTLLVPNRADSTNGTSTRIVFSAGAAIVGARRGPPRQPDSTEPQRWPAAPVVSRVGFWVVEPDVRAPLPVRTLCGRGGDCVAVGWPRDGGGGGGGGATSTVTKQDDEESEVVAGSNIVELEHVRLTVLTGALLRIEHRGARGSGYDDRPTLSFPYRSSASRVAFTVARPGPHQVVVRTANLTVHLNDSTHESPSCDAGAANTDKMDGNRLKGSVEDSKSDCCAACTKFAGCTAWIFGTDPPYGPSNENCWLMAGVTMTKPAAGRIFGRVTVPPAALSVEYTAADGEPQRTWHSGDADTGNLNGTRHSLDCYVGTDAEVAASCLAPGLLEKGLLSRDGLVLWEDTYRGRYDSDNVDTAWISDASAIDEAGEGYRDWYLLGHGQRYTEALRDFILVGGAPLLPPASALGVWWSRYNNYTQKTFVKQVLTGYADHALPLSHVVMDVDWHQFPGKASPAIPGCDGYGGFVWNSDLFPKPVEWVDYLHSAANPLGHPLKLLLNLHMDRGVDHCQPSYKAIGEAAGLDTSNGSVLKCNILNQNWTEALFKYAMGTPGQPTATQSGADYYWPDYSGCPSVRSAGCQSLDQHNCSQSMIWNNLMFARHQQMVDKRPLVLSRFGGLGNHRAPLGFSGDSHACWQTLKYQIGFTSAAANVLQTWSHDLGGFYAFDDGDPTNATGSELLLRWLQFGAVSPVFRTHCSGVHDGPRCLRRIWLFPHFEQMKSALVMRDGLLPYLMTSYRNFYETGIGVVHPCYYEHSQEPQAYDTADSQYRFGAEMLAAPITAAASDPLHGSVERTVWLPPGVWVEWGGARTHIGPANYTSNYTHSELPLFVKGGSAIPMKAASAPGDSGDLSWVIFPAGGREGSGLVYDDAGEGASYQQEEYSTTRLDYRTANWTAGAHVDVRLRPLHQCTGSGCAAWAGLQRSHSLELRGLASLGLRVQSVECSAGAGAGAGTGPGSTRRAAAGSSADDAPELVTLPGRSGLDDEVVARLWLAQHVIN